MILVLLVTGMSVRAQSIAARKVNCAFNSTRLDEVIHHLSLEAGVSFIYSSNKTDLSKVVTLSVENRSLEETLSMIGSQLGIEFKMQGLYVMIKQPETKTSRPSVSGKVPVGRISKLPSTTDAYNFNPASGRLPANRLIVPSFSERVLPVIEPSFSTTKINTIPLSEARKISVNNMHAGWFLSVGPLLNDYSSGFELQAGIRRAYFVMTPGWMSNGRFRAGFGLGTSIDVGHNLSFTPIYSLATPQHTQTTSWRNSQGVNELKVKEKTVHHQLKLMVQYAVTPAFVVKLGPTINQSSTTHDTYQTTMFIVRRSIVTPAIGGAGSAGNTVVVNQVDASSTPTLLSTQRTRNAWMGWEASIAFKINFLERK